LTGEHLSALKQFLATKQSEGKVRTTKSTNSQLSNVRGTGDVLVKLAKLEHR